MVLDVSETVMRRLVGVWTGVDGALLLLSLVSFGMVLYKSITGEKSAMVALPLRSISSSILRLRRSNSVSRAISQAIDILSPRDAHLGDGWCFSAHTMGNVLRADSASPLGLLRDGAPAHDHGLNW